MSKRCVVFGANGFIGSSLTRALLSEGHSVRACDVVRDFFALTPADRLECETVDFLDEVAVRNAVRGADWVFHLVSTTKPASSNANMAHDVQSNVVSSIHLFQACVDAGIERVLFASSGGTVYGVPEVLPVGEDHPVRPIVSYGLTKLMIERYAELFRRQHGLSTTSLRIGNPYGPRHYDQQQGVIPVFIRRIQHGQPVEIWGDGSVVRDYVHVDDVSRAFIAAAAYVGDEAVFNIGAGEGHSLAEILARLASLSETPPQVEYRPARGFDIPALILDTRRAREHLGWIPAINFDDGLSATWHSLK
ncbi:MAG: NAD-dependent epimerase/dehydratase family protein [Zoogloeaceae bacterium]|nr:NAD-dependent epimerase/dehydratase family protein [Zoogloeaceae bacterium]